LLHFYESLLEVRSLGEIDNMTSILPFLGLLDIVSTLWLTSQRYSLALCELGFFSGFFVGTGFAYAYGYGVIYMLIMVCIEYLLWYIKNKAFEPSQAFDKRLFAVLLVVTVYICVRLTGTFLLFLFLEIVDREISMLILTINIYAWSTLSLSAYLWHPVL
jgi:hypothetical protein